MGINVHWDCDLDAGDPDCRPHYSFHLQETTYNFRWAPPPPAAPWPGLLHLLSWSGRDRPTLGQLPGCPTVFREGPRGRKGCSQLQAQDGSVQHPS